MEVVASGWNFDDAGPDGPAVELTNSAATRIGFKASRGLRLGKHSWFTRLYFDSAMPLAQHIIWSESNNLSAGGVEYAIGTAGDHSIGMAYYKAGIKGWYGFADDIVFDKWVTVGGTWDFDTLIGFVNGIEHPSTASTASGGPPTYAAADVFALAWQGNNRSLIGKVSCLYVWDRVLTPPEFAALHADPYIFFRRNRALESVGAWGVAAGAPSSIVVLRRRIEGY